MAQKIIASSGINWCWFVGGEFNDEEHTVIIAFHERWHYGDEWPKKLYNLPYAEFAFMEDKERQVYGLQVKNYDRVPHENGGASYKYAGTTEYLILNPGYIFGYKDTSMLKETTDVQN